MITKLALRQLKAQWRRPDGRALLLSIFLMTSLITLLSLTGDRLEKSLTTRSAEILGADMVMSSHRPFPAGWDNQTAPFGLSTTKVTQFTSMVEAQDSMLLSAIRAVDAPYPLRGKVITDPPHLTSAPKSGTVWVEGSVLSRLKINIGDSLNIG